MIWLRLILLVSLFVTISQASLAVLRLDVDQADLLRGVLRKYSCGSLFGSFCPEYQLGGFERAFNSRSAIDAIIEKLAKKAEKVGGTSRKPEPKPEPENLVYNPFTKNFEPKQLPDTPGSGLHFLHALPKEAKKQTPKKQNKVTEAKVVNTATEKIQRENKQASSAPQTGSVKVLSAKRMAGSSVPDKPKSTSQVANHPALQAVEEKDSKDEL